MLPDGPFPVLTPQLASVLNSLSGFEPAAVTLILGEGGLGKTYILTTAAARLPFRHIAINAAEAITPEQLAEALLGKAGTDAAVLPCAEWPLAHLTEAVCDALSVDLTVVALDDAHLLSRQVLGWLRHLAHIPEVRLALAGHPHLAERLPLQLCERAWSIRLQPLDPHHVSEFLEYFHPIYIEASSATIEDVDERYAQGNLARWTDFTSCAVEICALNAVPFLTRAVAEEALAHLGRLDAAA